MIGDIHLPTIKELAAFSDQEREGSTTLTSERVVALPRAAKQNAAKSTTLVIKASFSCEDQSFRGHVQNLEQQGELVRVDAETDPHENVSAIGWKNI